MNSSATNLIFVVGIIFLMYFMMIRPQTKKAKEHQHLLSSLQTKDEIVTIGGIYGRIVKIEEQMVTLKVDSNSEIIVQKSAVAQVLPKGTLKFD